MNDNKAYLRLEYRGRDYSALMFISNIYKVLVWIVLITTILGGLSVLDVVSTNLWIGICSIVGVVLSVISFFTISEGIILFIHIANDLNQLTRDRKVAEEDNI